MTKPLLFLVSFMLTVMIAADAQVVTGHFSTSVYTFEKFDTVDVAKTIARGFQTLQLSVAEGDLSVQTSLYGASNLFGTWGEEDGVIRVSNLLVRWNNSAHAVDVSLGRIPIFAGVGNGTVDGGLVKLRAWEHKVSVTAYGGANVRPTLKSSGTENINNNFFIGGQIIGNVIQNTRLSLSYVNRRIQQNDYMVTRFDSLATPIAVLIAPDARAEQLVGFDVRYDNTQLLSLYGRYDYDVNTKRNLRLQVSTRVIATEELAFTGEYDRREPRLYYSSWFNIFPMSAIAAIEGGVDYNVSSSATLRGKFGYVKYTDASTNRFTLGTSFEYGNISYAGTTGYAGVLHSISAQCMYPLLERTLIPTVGLTYASYQLDETANQETMFAGTLGAIVRPMKSISFDVQAQWLTNKIVKNDLRLLAKVDYWFTHNLNLFTKEADDND